MVKSEELIAKNYHTQSTLPNNQTTFINNYKIIPTETLSLSKHLS